MGWRTPRRSPCPLPEPTRQAKPLKCIHQIEKQYRIPVNGLVIKLSVEPGQQVQPNEVIVVLEAMKMETNITAHHAGRVKCVNIAPGVPVKFHQVLFEMQ